MTTNNPPIAAWVPSTALHKLESRHNNAPCILTDGPAEFNDVALVRLADYVALQAELVDMERDYLAIIEAQDAEHRKQLARLQAECEKLRKGAEFGRSVLAKREPGKSYGCHCDLEEGMEPDRCVIDSNEHLLCNYATRIDVKEQCEYWRVIASDAATQGDQP